MGVHGLTTYLRENQRALSKKLEVSACDSTEAISVVVDGWSFIYELHRHSNLPWVYGGEYDQFCQLVSIVVQSWIKSGLKLYFVFDGAYPQLKFPTLVSRLGQSHIQPALLFFRTSSTSRSTGRFLHETQIIPPLSYAACLHALKAIQASADTIEIHFADGEGDPYAVELAGRIGGYVVGNDSDFVVLNIDGYLGYIPLDEMVWHLPTSTEIPADPAHTEGNQFQEVRKNKAKKRPFNERGIGKGIIPPDTGVSILSLTVYSPDKLAEHLKIPVTLLPLLGALVGNDFSKQPESNRHNVQSLFFNRQLSLSQRIGLVASTLQTILSPVSQKHKKQKHQIGSVMDLIDRAVNVLLARINATLGPGEVDTIVDKIIDATLQYAIPRQSEGEVKQNISWSSAVCALHEPDTCPLLPLFSRRVEAGETFDGGAIASRTQYLDAYRQGRLSPKAVDVLNSGTYWPRLFLENPDLKTVSVSIGRPIRDWVYAILHDGVGLPDTQEEDSQSTSGDSNSDDELIDVVESDESLDGNDPLAPLKGELYRLHGSGESCAQGTSVASSHPSRLSRPPVVTEYVRRGTRVAQEAVPVKALQELLLSISFLEGGDDSFTPLLLRPDQDRLGVLLQVLGSDIPPVRALPREQLLPVLALRWVVNITYNRAEDTNSREHAKEQWTRRDAICFLASFQWTASRITAEQAPPILDRNVQLMAQALMALESVELLAQVLLLADIPSSVHLFSGRAFHEYITGTRVLDQNIIPAALLEAGSHGLDPAFVEDRQGRKRPQKVPKSRGGVESRNLQGGGLFQLLADMV